MAWIEMRKATATTTTFDFNEFIQNADDTTIPET